MKFSESSNDRRRRIGDRAAVDSLRDRDNAAGIGDNSAEIGDGAAGIVDIAANVIPSQTPSWMETGVTLFLEDKFQRGGPLLKSDIFQHSKDYSTQSFGPTSMGLGSFWRGMKWVSQNVSTDLFRGNYFLNKFIKLLFFSKKFMRCSKNYIKFIFEYNEQKDILVHSESC